MSGLSTHVLDTAAGRPAARVGVVLETREGHRLCEAVTDAEGRVADLAPGGLTPGDYVLRFDSGAYVDGFYPEVVVVFTIGQDTEHYHVPLLLSPYGYSTYRGS